MKDNRERPLERMLAETLRTHAQEASASCLDAETLAAWVDGSLSARDRRTAESHAASCSRCQALAAAMIRMSPPQTAAAWWRAPLLLWAAPLTAAATAALVYVIIVDRSSQKPAQIPAAATMARAREATDGGPVSPPAAAAKPADTALRDSPARQRANEPAGPPADRLARSDRAKTDGELAKNAVPAAESAVTRAETPAATFAAASPAAVSSAPDPVSSPAAPPPPAVAATAAAAPASGVAVQPAAPPPAASPSAKALQETRADSSNSGATAETVQRRVAAEAAVAGQPPRVAQQAAVLGAFRTTAELLVVSSDPTVRWRIPAGGRLQRSVDGGASWQVQNTVATAPLVAGAAPSPTVCWLVGRSGTVLLSSDGRSWRRLAFPETIDLVAIRALDARTATVTTADGRTFTTTDAGQNWKDP